MNRFGFYEAMGRKFTSKLEAFGATIPYGHFPHWNFFEEEFSKYDWSVEPQTPLQDLYGERAKKIREKYEYVIISYSGGADSYNIAESFLRNNLRIDELMNRIHGDFINPENKKSTADNVANESIWAAWPTYLRFKNIQPDLKFTQWNWSKIFTDRWKNNKKNVYELNSYGPNSLIKSLVFQNSQLKNKRSTVMLFGTDKPHVFYKDNKFYMSFMDQLVNVHFPSTIEDDQGVDYDLFYWSLDSIRILIKQGHIIKQWFKKNKHLLYLLDVTMPDKQLYYNIVNSLIYPWFDKNIWQVDKQKNAFVTCEEWWFVKDKDITGTNNWMNFMYDLNHEVNTIYKDSKFLPRKEEQYSVLPWCYSKFYDIGC
jgi:hypothetical protein